MKVLYISVLFCFIKFVLSINVTLVGFLYSVDDSLSCISGKFNEYSKANNLGITLDTIFYTYKNSTADVENIQGFMQELTNKKEKSRYDMFLIDTIYNSNYINHFLNLYDYLPESITNLYKEGIATKTCIFDNKLTALPLYVDYGGLYYNELLLNKYNKTVPQTWDELIDTHNYIYYQESSIDPSLNKYSGLPKGEAGVAATLEFIHTFRDNKDDDFPEITSENAVNALKKMKEVKEKASDDVTFGLSQEELWSSIFGENKNYIFFRSWYIDDIYKPSTNGQREISLKFAPLPGNKPGISGSCVGGSNMSISKYLSKEKADAAVEVMKYLFNKEFQKYLVLNVKKISAMQSIYQDNEVCDVINCTIYGEMQGVVRPNNLAIDYEDYSNQLITQVRDYIIEGKTKKPEDVLTQIDDIRRIHYVEYSSISGIIIMVVVVIIFILLIFTYIFISIKRKRVQFKFLSFSYWCLYLIGTFLLVCSCFTHIGNIQNYSCYLRLFLITIGFTLSFIPFIIKITLNFPRRNTLINFIKKHENLTIIFFIALDVIIDILWIILDPPKTKVELIMYGPNFKICKSNNKIGTILTIILIIKALIILFVMFYLLLSEWNLVMYKSDITSITCALISTFINFTVYAIILFIHFNSRYVHNGFRCGIILVVCLSNLIVLVGSKITNIMFGNNKDNTYGPNINKFIDKTGCFNDNIEKELDFIDIDDIVDNKLVNKTPTTTTNKYKKNNNMKMNHYKNINNKNNSNNNTTTNTESTFYSSNSSFNNYLNTSTTSSNLTSSSANNNSSNL
ncbi:periplasmic binding protein-like II [Anaeromyces robustus]|uniref:Periplasmic binding protein-like II n=1 Tax=Anaeromyces robustus TaxID=1754192 RepID=A0A1Y1X8E6_9FUNG|nr:periplasmic binding protein-like II [Anaeromyces robustus]|eukprot:ORX82031.1 periplasmic binding protein-like II [Anaeromyces robustus]